MAMLAIPSRRVWTRQPQGPAGIDWANPLTRGLVDVIDLSGRPRSLVLGTPPTFFGAAPKQGSPTRYGRAADFRNAFGGVYFQRTDAAYAPATQTHLILGQFDLCTGQYAGYFATANGDGTEGSFGAQYVNTYLSVTSYPAGLAVGLSSQISGAGLNLYEFGGDSSNIQIYANGKLLGSANGSAVQAKSTSRLIIFGERAASASYAFKGQALLHLVYKRRLAADERLALVENIWQIFRPRTRRIFIDLGVGSSLNTAASGHAQASGSATLAVQVALAGIGIATAGGTAAASVAVPLAAAGITVASGAAGAQATVSISAAGLAQAAASAGLSASVLLAGAGAADAAGNAALAAHLSALAIGAAEASGSASLSGGAEGSIAAAGGAQASGAAVLSVAVQLQAAGAGQSSGTADGTASAPGSISATGSGAAGGAATLTATVSLTAAGFVQAMGQGTLAIGVDIAAFGAAQAGGSAAASLVVPAWLVIPAARRASSNRQISSRSPATSSRRPSSQSLMRR